MHVFLIIKIQENITLNSQLTIICETSCAACSGPPQYVPAPYASGDGADITRFPCKEIGINIQQISTLSLCSILMS